MPQLRRQLLNHFARFALPCLLLTTTAAGAAPIPLPTGARWFITAPNAGRFAREASALFASAAAHSEALSPTRVSSELADGVGVGLLDPAALESSGVDPDQPWMLFDRGGAEYLAVGVKNRAKLAATLDAWGAHRRLTQREQVKVDRPKGTMVTFGRGPGSRAAAGYLISGDRAIVMVRPFERTAELVAAWNAIEGAAPVKPGVDGTLLVWLGRETALRDGWIALTPRPDGIDIAGSARKMDPGFVDRGSADHADWIRALTGGDRSIREVPVWIRLAAGTKTGGQIIDALMPLLSDSLRGGGRHWLEALRAMSTGPVEIVASSVDVQTVENAAGGGIREDLLRLLHPVVAFVDRDPDVVGGNVAAATSVLCSAQADGDVVRAACTDPPLIVGKSASGLFFGWTKGKPPPVPLPGGEPLACVRGTPIAAMRLNLAVIGEGLNQVGFLGALSSESLAGMLGLGSEYGHLMRASEPAVWLACQEASGRVTLQGRWRFAPAR